MKKHFFAFILMLAMVVPAIGYQTTFNPFTGKLDYVGSGGGITAESDPVFTSAKTTGFRMTGPLTADAVSYMNGLEVKQSALDFMGMTAGIGLRLTGTSEYGFGSGLIFQGPFNTEQNVAAIAMDCPLAFNVMPVLGTDGQDISFYCGNPMMGDLTRAGNIFFKAGSNGNLEGNIWFGAVATYEGSVPGHEILPGDRNAYALGSLMVDRDFVTVGTIESRQGGVKFPDGSTQMTAAGAGNFVSKTGDTMTGPLTAEALSTLYGADVKQSPYNFFGMTAGAGVQITATSEYAFSSGLIFSGPFDASQNLSVISLDCPLTFNALPVLSTDGPDMVFYCGNPMMGSLTRAGNIFLQPSSDNNTLFGATWLGWSGTSEVESHQRLPGANNAYVRGGLMADGLSTFKGMVTVEGITNLNGVKVNDSPYTFLGQPVYMGTQYQATTESGFDAGVFFLGYDGTDKIPMMAIDCPVSLWTQSFATTDAQFVDIRAGSPQGGETTVRGNVYISAADSFTGVDTHEGIIVLGSASTNGTPAFYNLTGKDNVYMENKLQVMSDALIGGTAEVTKDLIVNNNIIAKDSLNFTKNFAIVNAISSLETVLSNPSGEVVWKIPSAEVFTSTADAYVGGSMRLKDEYDGGVLHSLTLHLNSGSNPGYGPRAAVKSGGELTLASNDQHAGEYILLAAKNFGVYFDGDANHTRKGEASSIATQFGSYSIGLQNSLWDNATYVRNYSSIKNIASSTESMAYRMAFIVSAEGFDGSNGTEAMDIYQNGAISLNSSAAVGGTFQTNAGVIFHRSVVGTSEYSVTAIDHIIGVTWTTSEAVKITIPTARLASGRQLIIKDEGLNAAARNITLTGEAGELFDGQLNATMTSNGASLSLYGNGSGWSIY